MDDDIRMLLKLLLQKEVEETEAGQGRRSRKKLTEPRQAEDGPEHLPTRRAAESSYEKRAREEDYARTSKQLYKPHENNVSEIKGVPIWEKYALSVSEASQYFHLGQKKLREIINKDRYANYLIWNGGHVYIKRRLFEEYLNNETEV